MRWSVVLARQGYNPLELEVEVEAEHVFRLLVMASLLRLHICCSAAVETNQGVESICTFA